ncbi:MAG: tripartite tricarboxylate transporter permease [Synergistaceae bacterium]|jgi:putative tricarboxylic transport membrane protein|nr:tripartite tricarboxylate transporter permease [Synergistaceae bacterium]
MNLLDLLVAGANVVFTPTILLFICIGNVTGVIFGALPGISAAMAVALMVPFTLTLDPIGSIAFLSAVYCSAITGGGIPAILFKIPGTPSSAVTTFDGFPLAQRGQAGKALLLVLVSSAFGGIVSAFAMLLVSRQLSSLGLQFGPSELFAIAFLGLSVLTSMDEDRMLKTVISGLTGLLLATIAMDPLEGTPRLTFGFVYLLGGIPMIPMMVGMFAVSEVLKQVCNPTEFDKIDGGYLKDSPMRLSFSEWWGLKWTMIRCSVLGTLVGILPGAGATIASFLGYGMEIKLSKHPEEFGNGSLTGLCASETSNNAATGGSMVPLLSLGIPGGNSAAVMVAALMLQGVQVGPMLLKAQPTYLSSVFISMIVTNVMMVFISIAVAKMFSKLIKIPYYSLGPLIILFAAVGSYAAQNNTGDVMVTMLAGLAGYFMAEFKYSPAALTLGLVLGDICENNLRRAVMIEHGDMLNVFSRPITATLLVLCVIFIIVPIIRKRMRDKHALLS